MSSPVLTLDANDPLCLNCATALGGTPVDWAVHMSERACAHCHRETACPAVRDFVWPDGLRRHAGKPWAAPDDYSDLANMLGGKP